MSALQLFCLPHARGSAAFYQRWRESLPQWIEVRPLALPDAEMPLGNARQADIAALAWQLASECLQAQQPCALFGHGLGGLLAFELAHALRLTRMGEPLALFVSGVVAPPRCTGGQRCTDIWLGEPDASEAQPAGYICRERTALSSPIHVLGRKQGAIAVEALLEWQQQTRGDFSLDMLQSHHFFIQQQEARLLRLVCRHGERHLRHWRLGSQRAAG